MKEEEQKYGQRYQQPLDTRHEGYRPSFNYTQPATDLSKMQVQITDVENSQSSSAKKPQQSSYTRLNEPTPVGRYTF